MSILSSVTSILQPTKIPIGVIAECKPTKCDDEKQQKGREESKKDDCEKQAKNDDHREDREKQAKNDEHRDEHEKQAKNDEHRDEHEKQAKNDDHREDHEKQAKNDDHREDHEKQVKNDDHREDHEKQAKNDEHRDDHEKQVKNDDCQPHKDYCQPQCDPKPDDCGKAVTAHNMGDVLAKLDFAKGDFVSHGPDSSADIHGALASMSSGHALDYAIGQMGPQDHFDVGHVEMPADTSSHEIAHHVV